jgi:hypothetical protein
MNVVQRELQRKGYFRRVMIDGRKYYFPISVTLARRLPQREVFFGSFKQAMVAERLNLR